MSELTGNPRPEKSEKVHEQISHLFIECWSDCIVIQYKYNLSLYIFGLYDFKNIFNYSFTMWYCSDVLIFYWLFRNRVKSPEAPSPLPSVRLPERSSEGSYWDHEAVLVRIARLSPWFWLYLSGIQKAQQRKVYVRGVLLNPECSLGVFFVDIGEDIAL